MKPTVFFKSTSESGNIFFIINSVRQELRKQGNEAQCTEIWERVRESGSYVSALQVIREYVNLIDIDNKY